MSDVILQDDLTVFPHNKTAYRVQLTRGYLQYARTQGKPRERRVLLSDVVGCHCLRGRHASDSAAYFCIYAYPLRKKVISGDWTRHRVCTTFRVRTTDDHAENHTRAEQWRIAIKCLLAGQSIGPQTDLEASLLPPSPRLLILINPFGGQGKAQQIFRERVVSMLGEADISFNMVVTERSGHAHDLMRDLDVSEWNGVVVVSGDGLIYEVINGLMDRPDWEEAIKMPIGLIPGGTGNALCCSVNYLLDEPFESADQVLHSTFVLCKSVVSGSSYPMDLVSVQTQSSRIFSFLHISWGFISDIDIGSEKYRYLGDARFIVGLMQRLFDLRKYPGHVSYLPVKGVDGRALVHQITEKRKQREKLKQSLPHPRSLSKQNGEREDLRSMRPAQFTRSVSMMEGSLPRNLPPRSASVSQSFYSNMEPLTPGVDAAKEAALFNEQTDSGVPTSERMEENMANGHATVDDIQASDWTEDETPASEVFSPYVDSPNALVSNTNSHRPQQHNHSNNSATNSQSGDSMDSAIDVSAMDLSTDSPTQATLPNPDGQTRRHGPADTLLPPLGHPLPDGWVTIEGNFNLVMGLNVPHISTGFNMSPASNLDDGMMFLMYAMNTTRSEMSNISLKASQGRIGEVDQPGTDVVAVHAFRLEPRAEKGLITADGEVIEYGPLQAQVHHALARVLMWKPIEM
ncbi:PREDICTED: sphingosine kinase 2-like [Branchiostoma belcheri]|uniref:sphingosine kinase n=1 Tax=Branchiostoma belcheri TaxID=7741 RepID=A0A6P4YUY1_BRABE|nr:PREDICTED: sphingosine kinase 2-like [Branchiostoma belcheri]